jgi:formylglycine-generating enzyme required for sulfatase activity
MTAAACLAVSACGERSFHEVEVEVAPGKFVTTKRRGKSLDDEPSFRERLKLFRQSEKRWGKEWFELLIPWEGRSVRWIDVGSPCTLREFENRLYVISFDWSDFPPRYRFYRQQGETFVEISPAEFPKQVAVENIFTAASRYMRSPEGEIEQDEVKLARELNPTDRDFANTHTAEIWYLLMTGRQPGQFDAPDRATLEEFIRRYTPIRLTQVLREHPGAMAAEQPLPPRRLRSKSRGTVYEVDLIVGNLMLAPATGPQGFLQGSPRSEAGRDARDEDQFKHVLTRKLAVMQTEVTRGMWAKLRERQKELSEDPSRPEKSCGPDEPVQFVQWCEAVLFANLLSLERGLQPAYCTDGDLRRPVRKREEVTDAVVCRFEAEGFRLPTEGEWEWSARGGTTGPFSVEEPDYRESTMECPKGKLRRLEAAAWFCPNSGFRAHPVQSAPDPNHPWGLEDVHGNVMEWCWDCDQVQTPYPAAGQTDYAGESSCSFRVIRGGSWRSFARFLRVAFRASHAPDERSDDVGFRLVRTIR